MSNLSPDLLAGFTVIQTRAPLVRTARALANGALSIGFVGGSITADNGGNWPDPVIAWFMDAFPSLSLAIENAAIGATGSDSGCLRADEEIIACGCDLCFVEYTVNDRLTATERRARTREGLIRKLLAAGIDVVLVYTFCQPMYADMIDGRVPASVAEFEALARHYNLGSVWAGLHALNQVKAGKLKWHQWLPDGLHPSPLGSGVYGEAVIAFLEQQIRPATPAVLERSPSPVLPAPLDPLNWQNVTAFPLEAVEKTGPWVLKRVHDVRHVQRVLETHAIGAQLRIRFNGRGLALIFEYGKISSEFRYRLDEGAWILVKRDRFDWAGDRGRVDPFVAGDDLPLGYHVFEMEIIHGDRPECGGTECRLAQVSVL